MKEELGRGGGGKTPGSLGLFGGKKNKPRPGKNRGAGETERHGAPRNKDVEKPGKGWCWEARRMVGPGVKRKQKGGFRRPKWGGWGLMLTAVVGLGKRRIWGGKRGRRREKKAMCFDEKRRGPGAKGDCQKSWRVYWMERNGERECHKLTYGLGPGSGRRGVW